MYNSATNQILFVSYALSDFQIILFDCSFESYRRKAIAEVI